MGQNKSEIPSGPLKQTLTFCMPTARTATQDPEVRYITPVGITPLALRVTPLAAFVRNDSDETYVVSLEDDGTKISTDNGAVTNANAADAIEATFAASTHVAKDSVLEVVLTLGGTTPSLAAKSIISLDFIED
jgi:hypothetical protein